MTHHRALLSWSSGKDAAWALHLLRRAGEVEVVGLLTTLRQDLDRVSMHEVRRDIVEAQTHAAGLPLLAVPLPSPCPNDVYERAMSEVLDRARGEGVTAVVFGDLFLEDVRRYREERLAGTGLAPLFPLWGLDTARLSREMVAAGLRARVTSVDTARLDASFAGRVYDDALLDDLPEGVDPCGEHGEMHTCVTAGPMFDVDLSVRPGEVEVREGFAYADLELII